MSGTDKPSNTARDWEGEYKALSHALVGDTGLSAILEAVKHTRMRAALCYIADTPDAALHSHAVAVCPRKPMEPSASMASVSAS